MSTNVTFEGSDGEKGLEARGRWTDPKNVKVVTAHKKEGDTVTLPEGAEWIAAYVAHLSDKKEHKA